jgi:hypothetical protein
MSKLTLIAALCACAAAPAYAQYYDRPTECWNPGAGHFEQVRPGEYQNDLDFNRCRVIGDRRADRYYRDADRYNRDADRAYYYRNEPYYRADAGRECWNPRAGHFEMVRPGEYQGDLDYRQCRMR